MPEIVMYTTGVCPYCVHAKTLLRRKGMRWQEKRIDLDHSVASEMQQRSRRRSVPQIFIDEHHVGGYEDMAELEAAGELDPLLGLDAMAMPDNRAHDIDASEDAPT